MTIDHVHVDLAGRSYDIKIGQGLITDAASHIAPMLKRKSVAIVTAARPATAILGAPIYDLQAAKDIVEVLHGSS